MKLKKGSAEAKRFMASIRAKKKGAKKTAVKKAPKKLGNIKKEKVYIEYYNKDKDFKKDTKNFNSYIDAVNWGKKNFDKFSYDMIKYKSLSGVKKTPKKTAVKKASIHKDTKSHNVKISVVSGLQNNTLKEIKETLADIESMNKQIILLQNDIKNYKPNQRGQISKWQLRQYLAVSKSYKKDNERHLNRLKKLL